MFFDLFAGEVTAFGVKDFSAAFGDLTFALSAAAFSTAGRRKIDALFREGGEEVPAHRHFNFVFGVDANLHCSSGRKITFGNQEDDDQKEDDNKEYDYAGENESNVHFD